MFENFKIDMLGKFYFLEVLFMPFSEGVKNKHAYIEKCTEIAKHCKKLSIQCAKMMNNLPNDAPGSEMTDLLFIYVALLDCYNATMKHVADTVKLPSHEFSKEWNIKESLGKYLDRFFEKENEGWKLLVENIEKMERYLGWA